MDAKKQKLINEMKELKWKIVGDKIGHVMSTIDIVEMYAEDFGYARALPPGNQLLALDEIECGDKIMKVIMNNWDGGAVNPAELYGKIMRVISKFGTQAAAMPPEKQLSNNLYNALKELIEKYEDKIPQLCPKHLDAVEAMIEYEDFYLGWAK